MSMNHKRLDQYKEDFLGFLDMLPIAQMEDNIKNNHDPLVEHLYKKLNYCMAETTDLRYKEIYHNISICMLFGLADPCYGDLMRFLFQDLKKTSFDMKAKPPRLWRVNNTHKSGQRKENWRKT